MSVRWNIDHAARQVEAVAEGSLSASDVLDYLETIAEAGAMSYAKMFDASAAKATMSIDELKAIGAWVRKFAMEGGGPIGPLAIIVTSGSHFDAAHFADAAGSSRPLKIFRDKADATAWLAQVLRTVGKQR